MQRLAHYNINCPDPHQKLVCCNLHMTGRTHDLAAFTALNATFLATQSPQMTTSSISFATAICALGANMIGGLIPDIDSATSDIWDKFRGGNVIAPIIRPFIGRHRTISHSLLGMVIIGYVLRAVLALMGTVLLVDMTIVWWAMMIGVASHLITDAMTRQGIPLLFPLSIRFGIPPFEFMRMKTGGLIEKLIVFPGLILLNGYLVYANYSTYLHLLRGFYK